MTSMMGQMLDRFTVFETALQRVTVDVAMLQKRPVEDDPEPIVEDTESSGPSPPPPSRAARADGGIHIREPVLEEIVAERLRPAT